MINQEQLEAIINSIHNLNKSVTTPQEVSQIIFNICAGVVGPLSDTLWKRIQDAGSAPCGEPNCTCHIASKDLFESLGNLHCEFQQRFGI